MAGEQWFYMASGQVHGPFDLDRMRAWYQHGFFEDDLDVSRGARNNFQKLRMFQEITSVGKIGATPERAAPVASGAAAASVRVNRHGSISIGGGGAAATAAEAAQQPLYATPQRSANAAAATAWTPQQVAAAMKPMAAQAGVAQQQQQAQSQSLRSSGADPSASYFYTVAGTEYGPFSRRQLQAWATAGYFTEDYAVRAAAGGASGVLSDIANMPQDTKPAVGGDRPGMPMVVDAFEKAIESLGPQNDGGLQGATSTDLVATGNDAIMSSMSYGELRKMSEQVRNTQMQLSTHCEALESGLLEKIQTLEANQRRQELTIAAKNRECEELRADNEKLQLYVRLTTSQSQASSAVAYGASQGGMGALRS